MNHFVSSLLFSLTNIGQHIHFFRKYYSYVVPSLMRGTQYSTQTCNVTVRGFAYHLLGTATHLGPWMTAIFHDTLFSDMWSFSFSLNPTSLAMTCTKPLPVPGFKPMTSMMQGSGTNSYTTAGQQIHIKTYVMVYFHIFFIFLLQ